MIYLKIFAGSLILTLIIELVVAVILGVRGKEELLLVILVNVLTNPAVVFLNLCGECFTWWNTLCQLPLEAIAIVAEAVIYTRFSKKPGWKITHPVLLSIIANVISYGVGCLYIVK